MKHLINKLFERLSYVPKTHMRDYARLLKESELHESVISSIKCGAARYEYLNHLYCYEVHLVTRDSKAYHLYLPIKVFPYTPETKDYARICAEELCEMLNQK